MVLPLKKARSASCARAGIATASASAAAEAHFTHVTEPNIRCISGLRCAVIIALRPSGKPNRNRPAVPSIPSVADFVYDRTGGGRAPGRHQQDSATAVDHVDRKSTR